VVDLLRRAWDALDSFKQAYPENWTEEDEQVLKGLSRADLKLSGVKLKWVGLTDSEVMEAWDGVIKYAPGEMRVKDFAQAIQDKLREKNT
jgi:hypothetical protein